MTTLQVEPLPPEIMNLIYSDRIYRNLMGWLNHSSKSAKKEYEQVLLIVIGSSDRDAYFYHFFLCSLIAYCATPPYIVLLVDDSKGNSNAIWFPANRIFYLSKIRTLLSLPFEQYKDNPFFYRFAGLLICEALGIELKQLIVCDNDILISKDLRTLIGQNIVCKYNNDDNSDDLAHLLTRECKNIEPSFFLKCKGAYGDFFFLLENSSANRENITQICQEGLPPEIPYSNYSYWWLSWIRFLNLAGISGFDALLPSVSESNVYTNHLGKVLFHVGGGYGSQKIGVFTSKLLQEDEVLRVSSIDKNILEQLVIHFQFKEDRNEWRRYLSSDQ